jgi:hypothetical protein
VALDWKTVGNVEGGVEKERKIERREQDRA